ncbi:X-Pro dipeptidyl-peptidase (S15 family) [Streptococcus henryi]|uniref:X-Pro dipeptidyl-peptidase (S15 family) n=1 Tax=Streptococcus henryi TaxID=439219 RepID=A0A1G6AF73_9STRE|nr:CocE/NonD family hydrolase [Streptococcus henryi]SDB07059.1 X-Pro dipeptidyl-peptidase (S15 family) [Streptococcus henryi]
MEKIFIAGLQTFMFKGNDTCFIIRTPYDASKYIDWANRINSDYGYSVLLQDVRGRYGSFGKWVPYDNEKKDSVILLSFIKSQDFSNIVIIGSSYEAYCARILAFESQYSIPTKLLIRVGVRNKLEAIFNDGVFRLGDFVWWKNVHGTGKTSKKNVITNQIIKEIETSDPPEKIIDADVIFPKVPVIIIAGWKDGYCKYAFDDYKKWLHDQKQLIVTPLTHDLKYIGKYFNEVDWYKDLQIKKGFSKIYFQNVKNEVYPNFFLYNDKKYERLIFSDFIGNNITNSNDASKKLGIFLDNNFVNLEIKDFQYLNSLNLFYETIEEDIFGEIFYIDKDGKMLFLTEFILKKGTNSTVFPPISIKKVNKSISLKIMFSNNLFPRYPKKEKSVYLQLKGVLYGGKYC